MQTVRVAKYSLRAVPREDDFRTIKAGESFSADFVAEVKQGKIDFGVVYEGVYLDFGDSYILLSSGAGNYLLEGKAKNNENWRVEGEKIGLTNIWSGEMLSNKVKIVIK